MAKTKIGWTDYVWNCLRGCSPISPGCAHCYAARMCSRGLPALLSQTTGEPFAIHGKWTGRVELIEHKLAEPLRWRKPRRVFVNSMSDLFHEALSAETIYRIFAVMELTPHITYQILTKRSGYMRKVMKEIYGQGNFGGPLPNVWLGVSCEDQQRADERIPDLLATPAAVRFVSCEPLLGPIDLERVSLPDSYLRMNGITGCLQPLAEKDTESDDYRYWRRKELKIGWVIVGSESGPGARPFNEDWARSLRDQCQAAGVPFFYKQAMRNGKLVALPELDGRQWAEFPKGGGA